MTYSSVLTQGLWRVSLFFFFASIHDSLSTHPIHQYTHIHTYPCTHTCAHRNTCHVHVSCRHSGTHIAHRETQCAHTDTQTHTLQTKDLPPDFPNPGLLVLWANHYFLQSRISPIGSPHHSVYNWGSHRAAADSSF